MPGAESTTGRVEGDEDKEILGLQFFGGWGGGADQGACLVAQMVKNLPVMQETCLHPRVGKLPWRRKWQPTAAFLPGESHGQRSLAGYSPRGRKESDTTEQEPALGQAASF